MNTTRNVADQLRACDKFLSSNGNSTTQWLLNMPKMKSEVERAAGKLVSAIQKEWGHDLGEAHAEFSENVVNSAHDLLQASSADGIRELLGARNVTQFLGEVWVRKHPTVRPAIECLEALLKVP